jgi:primase-polymerase (primpol)-like protein
MKQIVFENIPEQLRQHDQWVLWRRQKRRGKVTKVPYCARTGQMASSTEPATWSSFDRAVAAYKAGGYSGIGFVFTSKDEVVGIDLDKCRDTENGHIADWAAKIIAQIDTYSEVSPSGEGVHLYAFGKLPDACRKKGHIEVYESGRYFTVTGHHVPGTPLSVEARGDSVRAFHEEVFGAAIAGVIASSPISARRDDADVLAKARSAKNGAKFSRLFGGDWSDYPSQSEADLALCIILTYWTSGDSEQVDRLFRQSGLYRAKWDERHYSGNRTYGEMTVETATARSAKAASSPRPAAQSQGLPALVVTDRPLPDMTGDTLKALVATNEPPIIFVRSASICRVRNDENKRPLIEQLTESQLRHHVARSAYFLKQTREGQQHVPPPMDIVKDLMGQGHWPFPALHGIVEIPVLRPDGTLVDTAGYDPATKLVYCPAEGLRMPAIPAAPTPEQVARSLDVINELIGEFAFANAASKTNAIAALLTPLVRPTIPGPTPLCLIDAPQAGTGKGLLAECIAVVATGRSATLMTAPDTDDEWRKRITAMLLEGATAIAIDNLEGKLDAPSLASALTSIIWKDRILGRSEMAALPQRASWVATGNNIRLGGDMPRRCYLVRLDAKVARPWLRSGWRHGNLGEWAIEHRGEQECEQYGIGPIWRERPPSRSGDSALTSARSAC